MKSMRLRYPLNLQLFAEGDGGVEGGSGDGGENASGAGENQDQKAAEKVTFTADQQAEVDRILGERLGKAQTKWEKDFQAKLDEAKTEAEKLAKMNAEQKAEYEQKKREDDLGKREAEITRRELRATALETLAEKGLPSKLAEILSYADAESTSASIEAVEKAFKEAVETGVTERLKGKAPKGGSALTPQVGELGKKIAQQQFQGDGSNAEKRQKFFS